MCTVASFPGPIQLSVTLAEPGNEATCTEICHRLIYPYLTHSGYIYNIMRVLIRAMDGAWCDRSPFHTSTGTATTSTAKRVLNSCHQLFPRERLGSRDDTT